MIFLFFIYLPNRGRNLCFCLKIIYEVFMSNSIGLYIHIPFCKHKCPYCDFFSGNADENAFDNYVIELKDKIKYWSEKAKRDIATVYFGGGTPSVLGADRLCDILDFIKLILIFKIMPRLRLKSIPTPPKLLILKKCMPADLIAFQWVCRLLLKMN